MINPRKVIKTVKDLKNSKKKTTTTPNNVYSNKSPYADVAPKQSNMSTQGTSSAPPKNIQRVELNQEAKDAILPYDPAFQALKNAPSPPATKPSFIRDASSGKVTGIKLPNGAVFNGNWKDVSVVLQDWRNKNPQADPEVEAIQAEIDRGKLKDKMIAEQTPENVSAEQLSRLGQLSPEQQAYANSNAELSGRPALKDVLATAGERASIAAAGAVPIGAGIGLAGGPLAPVTVPTAVGIAAGGAGLVGGISGVWSSYKDVSSDNVKEIDNNVALAKKNLNDALSLANRGGDYDTVQMMLGNSIAQLNLAERQYKEQQRTLFSGKTDPDIKMRDLQQYKNYILPAKIERISIALQKPDPNYLDYGSIESATEDYNNG